MNVKLLKKVRGRILRIGKKGLFDMGTWSGAWWNSPRDESAVTKKEVCSTERCIAGEAVLAANAFKKVKVYDGDIDKTVVAWIPKVHGSWGDTAQEVLKLTEEQARRLFHSEYWPTQFMLNDHNAKNAAARIDHFIATKGVE